MDIPNLPKKKKTLEADITPRIIQWFVENYPHTVALEIKIEDRKAYPHQETALRQVAQGIFSHKIRDTGKNPFDAVILKGASAVLVRYYPKTKECVAYRYDGGYTFSFLLKPLAK